MIKLYKFQGELISPQGDYEVQVKKIKWVLNSTIFGKTRNQIQENIYITTC